MSDDIKKCAFFANARLLWETMGIVPLMYGSLGLEYLTGENLNADDIDVLVPRSFMAERWPEFRGILEKQGYFLVDEQEHEFEKEGIHYAYAQMEELESFAGIPIMEIETVQAEGASFKLLSLEQYLKVYIASAKDGYRVEVRNKKDAEKITFIRERLEKTSHKRF